MFRVRPYRIDGMKGAISSFPFEKGAHRPPTVKIVGH